MPQALRYDAKSESLEYVIACKLLIFLNES